MNGQITQVIKGCIELLKQDGNGIVVDVFAAILRGLF